MTSSHRTMIRLVMIVTILVALIIIAALYSIQIIHGREYAGKAGDQYTRPRGAVFDRGTIYFESKDKMRVAAATVEQGNAIILNPKLLGNPEEVYQALSEFLKIDKVRFLKSAGNTEDLYQELTHRVNDSVAQSISALKIKGVNVERESWRSYPGGTLSAQTLGIVGENTSTSTIQGKYGLEKVYEDVLNRPNVGSSMSIFAQLFDGVRGAFSSDTGRGDIVTSIEPTVEGYLEKVISDTNTTWHADEIGGIIIDPRTGAIIAMASLPTFNGNDTSLISDVKIFSNPLVEHVYEMGSILKPLTIAAGIDSGAITADWTYDDTGTMTLNSKTIGNWDRKAHGRTSVKELLTQSLNVGAATVGLKVGNEKMYQYFNSFGLGEKTGIDLPNEAKGLIGKVKSGQDIEVATASYGQGIAVSPIEITRALSILANGGYSTVPHVVTEIQYEDGSKKQIPLVKEGPILKAGTVRDVTSMLVSVVDEVLKKGEMKMEHYSIAAKTGTAQIPDSVHGGYYPDRYLHSFFGYFPAYDPKFLVFLYQIHPKGAQFASETLAEPFGNITKFLINYYNIPPDR